MLVAGAWILAVACWALFSKTTRPASVSAGLYVVYPTVAALVKGITVQRGGLVLVAVLGGLIASAVVAWCKFGVAARVLPVAAYAVGLSVFALFEVSTVPYAAFPFNKAQAFILLVVLPSVLLIALRQVEVDAIAVVLACVAAPLAISALLGGLNGLQFGPSQLDHFYQSNSVWFGRALALGVVACCLLVRRSGISRVWAPIGLLEVGGLITANKVGPVLGAAVGALVVLRLRTGIRLRQLLVGAIPLMAAAIVVPSTLASLYGAAAADLNGDQNASVRLVFLRQAYEMFRSHLLVGSGLGTFQAQDRGRAIFYPHNLVAEVAAERGIVGLVLLVILLVVAFRRRATPALPLAVCALVFAMSSGGLPENVEWPVLLATFVACSHKAQSKPPPPAPASRQPLRYVNSTRPARNPIGV